MAPGYTFGSEAKKLEELPEGYTRAFVYGSLMNADVRKKNLKVHMQH